MSSRGSPDPDHDDSQPSLPSNSYIMGGPAQEGPLGSIVTGVARPRPQPTRQPATVEDEIPSLEGLEEDKPKEEQTKEVKEDVEKQLDNKDESTTQDSVEEEKKKTKQWNYRRDDEDDYQPPTKQIKA